MLDCTTFRKPCVFIHLNSEERITLEHRDLCALCFPEVWYLFHL